MQDRADVWDYIAERDFACGDANGSAVQRCGFKDCQPSDVGATEDNTWDAQESATRSRPQRLAASNVPGKAAVCAS